MQRILGGKGAGSRHEEIAFHFVEFGAAAMQQAFS
jgi:hypothetical protein